MILIPISIGSWWILEHVDVFVIVSISYNFFDFFMFMRSENLPRSFYPAKLLLKA